MTCRKKSYHHRLSCRTRTSITSRQQLYQVDNSYTSRQNVGQKSYGVFKHSPKGSSLLKTFNHPNNIYHTDKNKILFTSHFTRATTIL